ncbi:hypothetical protein B9J78_05565 [bacterium Unc6]|nr:hypothetical protein [bacterium Unc6]
MPCSCLLWGKTARLPIDYIRLEKKAKISHKNLQICETENKEQLTVVIQGLKQSEDNLSFGSNLF